MNFKLLRTMTRQEKKEEQIGLFAVGAIFIGDLIDECFDFGEQQPHWISVEDELPHAEQDNATNLGAFLFYTEPINEKGSFEGRYRTGFYDSVTGTYKIRPNHFGNTRVTHWMPLPQPVVSKSRNAHIIGTAEHIKIALDVMRRKGGEK